MKDGRSDAPEPEPGSAAAPGPGGADAERGSPGGRIGLLGAAKRVVRRVIPKSRFKRTIAGDLRGHGRHLGVLSSSVQGLQEFTGDLHATVNAQGEHLDDLEGRLADLRETVEKRRDEARTFEAALRADQDRLEALVADLERRFRPNLGFDHFDFARRHRGEEGEVKERLQVYARLYGPVARVLDVGCGRGEFLEVCREAGVGAYGVETDPDMVSRCRMKALEVHEEDALSHLRALEDRSLDGVFMAQVIEHLTAAEIVELVQLAARKLKRGALFISETINTDTLSALRWFYMDPTHRQPVPAGTIRFLLEDAGFVLRDVLYLSRPDPEETLRPLPEPERADEPLAELVRSYNQNLAKLDELLFGAQDYAVIAEC